MTGNITRIEIWSKEKWAENSNYDDMDAIAEGMQEMGIVIRSGIQAHIGFTEGNH